MQLKKSKDSAVSASVSSVHAAETVTRSRQQVQSGSFCMKHAVSGYQKAWEDFPAPEHLCGSPLYKITCGNLLVLLGIVFSKAVPGPPDSIWMCRQAMESM